MFVRFVYVLPKLVARVNVLSKVVMECTWHAFGSAFSKKYFTRASSTRACHPGASRSISVNHEHVPDWLLSVLALAVQRNLGLSHFVAHV